MILIRLAIIWPLICMFVTFATDLRSLVKASVSVPSLTAGIEILPSSWTGVALEVEGSLILFVDPFETGVRLPAGDITEAVEDGE